LCFCALVFLCPSLTSAADLDFPYAGVQIKLPPQEDPFPGIGNYYSTLSKGMETALWNPASLAKLSLSEASISTLGPLERYTYNRSFEIAETSGDLMLDGGTTAAGEYGIFYRSPAAIGSGINTKEVEVMTHSNFATEGTGVNFNSALRVNEWITIGFAATSPLAADMAASGDFPLTVRSDIDFRGQSTPDMEITNAGKLKYTYDVGPTIVTYESTGTVWTGFLSQEATIPSTTYGEFRNNVNIESPYMGSIASKIGKLSLGVNMIPISATANIDNDLQVAVNSDADDIILYFPNFDPTNELEIVNWVNDPNQYGTSAGYSEKQFNVHEGEILGTARYTGYYTASTTRFDIGSMYDITDWLTVGVVFENFGGASLNMKGNGISTFINYRDVNTSEVDQLQNLIDPGGLTEIDLLADEWITTDEVNSIKLLLEPEKNYPLPKRIRYGIALKKPWLIAIDFEQNTNPISFVATINNVEETITVSNINFVRIGGETQIFRLPAWFRGGTTLMLKPEITGLDADTQNTVNNAFRYGALPIKLDLGLDMNFWGTLIGNSLGINAQSIISVLQVDVTNMDLTKMIYSNFYVARGPWQISWLISADPLASAAAYGSRTPPPGQKKEIELSDLKYVQTFGVTYKF